LLTHGVIKDSSLEITPSTEGGDFPIPQVGYGINDIGLISGDVLCCLFQLDEVITEQLSFTQGGQDCSQG
jgi:hypothetical protein